MMVSLILKTPLIKITMPPVIKRTMISNWGFRIILLSYKLKIVASNLTMSRKIFYKVWHCTILHNSTRSDSGFILT